MKIPFVDLKPQYFQIKSEVNEAIEKVLENTSFIGGEIVRDFENNFAAYLGVRNCIGCANGTDALEIALKVLGVGNGDEVIVPAMTWIATAEAVSSLGATPVFVDVHDQFHTIDVNLIEEKITERTKVIIPVHLYGYPAQMMEIMTLANKYGLKVIEDCAQSHGARIGSKTVGNFGDIATFSFYPGKNLGAYGDAGAIVTNDEELANLCRMVANHGQKGKHNHLIEGRNSRLDTIHAAILDVKLKYLPAWTELRQEKASRYIDLLADNKQIQLPAIEKGSTHVFHVFAIKIPQRDLLKSKLYESGIATQIHYPYALPIMPAYTYLNLNPNNYKNAIVLGEQELSLPLYPEISNQMIDEVIERIEKNIP